MLRMVLVVALTGCSFGLGPPSKPKLTDCSYTLPTLDAVVSGLSLVVATALIVTAATCNKPKGEAADFGGCYGNQMAAGSVGIPAGVLALLYGGGAAYGIVAERQCFQRARAMPVTPATP